MKTKYIYIIIASILVLGLIFYIGREIGKKIQADKQIDKQIQYIHIENKEAEKRADSLSKIVDNLQKDNKELKKKETNKKDKADQITIVRPEPGEDCDKLFDDASEKIVLLEGVIVIKDSIENNLNKTIATKDKIILEKDFIIKNKDEEIALLNIKNKPRDKKWAISLHLGTGYGVATQGNSVTFQRVPVYAGIGISRNIFSF